ncbi:uncharacterized protein LOC130974747 [Arachis stenosperma]|uniref:uncharacterized protein LOC130974747 n=1 Tax=Arachis stenosperma TaxID=217475 RepID=UPI0025AC3086|nr:uncharacterized protein LOC130974747 [Arachis stenosperma]
MVSEGGCSSTQRVRLPSHIRCMEAGDEKDDITLMCRCGVYAVLYKSRTPTNPNQLFLGCPFFKLKNSSHYKFFVWIDDHVAKIGTREKSITDNEVDDLEQCLCKNKVEQRLVKLEKKLACLEREKKSNLWIIVVCLVVICTAVVVIKCY